MSALVCDVCPRGCRLLPSAFGACRTRGNVGGTLTPTGYGRITSLAVDPVEKKPLARWRSGSTVLSLGGYGCNLRCPWCQNSSISQVGESEVAWQEVLPKDLVSYALGLHEADKAMVGIAYTYNEPLVCWEYVRDAGRLAHEVGLANVLVSAGCINEWVVREVAPYLDAANVDLKSIRSSTYNALGGDVKTVQHSIAMLAAEPGCHLEVTTLVVPGVNDSVAEMRELASWLASVDAHIVLHVTRFFPAWRMRDRHPTPVSSVYELADIAREYLSDVVTGNC